MSSEEIAVMRAVHHAYCHDTGCFDGDDISNPKITAALEDYAKMILAQQPCYEMWHEEANGNHSPEPCGVCPTCTVRAGATGER